MEILVAFFMVSFTFGWITSKFEVPVTPTTVLGSLILLVAVFVSPSPETGFLAYILGLVISKALWVYSQTAWIRNIFTFEAQLTNVFIALAMFSAGFILVMILS